MKHWSLKTKSFALVGAVALISLSTMFYEIRVSNENALHGEQATTRMLAESTIDKIDRNLFERYGDVQAFALSEPARSGDPTRITSFMTDMMGAYAPIYSLMMVVNLKGKVIAVNSVDKDGKSIPTGQLIGKDFSGATWFKACASGDVKPATAFVEDLFLDSDVAKIYGTDGKSMSFSSPIRSSSDGRVLGVWTNRMSWKDVVETIVSEQIQSFKLSTKAPVFPFIVSKTGQFLIHPDGDSFVLKENDPNFGKLNEALSKQAHFLGYEKIKATEYSGSVNTASVKSKGYASYPGMGWISTVKLVPEADLSFVDEICNGSTLVLMVLVFVFAFQFFSKNTNQFQLVIDALTADAEKLKNGASRLDESARGLASAATESAASLQETASSVDEITAMVKKTADSAASSLSAASKNQENAHEGNQVVEQMTQSISKIRESNATIMDQFSNNNQQLTGIIRIISEIGNKTKVINDIAFQTKLLSFNASVEAARAGEHGKGFAVVAEEVGNLAHMSGSAAKEINDMLADSVKSVQSVVDDTKAKVERLMDDGKRRVEDGIGIAKRCGDVLGEIVKSEDDMSAMINEINTAATEQSQGIGEINRAVSQLDEVTHRNATAAQEAADLSSEMALAADKVMAQVRTLVSIVMGEKGLSKTNAPQPRVAKPSGNLVGVSTPKVEPKRTAASAPDNVVQFPANAGLGKRQTELKTAVNADEKLPNSDDPRFQEI